MTQNQKITDAFNSFTKQMNESKMEEQRLAIDKAIFIGVGGSRAYGTETINSDCDLRGVFIGKRKHYLGLNTIEQVEIKRDDGSNEKDVMMEFRKFVNLALANNPNIIEQLFLKPEHNLLVKQPFQVLIDNRNLFLSKKAKHTYSGYAFSQLKRIQGHYNWLENPPTEPKRENYEVTRYKNKHTGKVIPENDYDKKQQRIKELKIAGNNTETNHFFENLEDWEKIKDVDKNSWNEANTKWEQYNTWRKNRNENRALLEKKYLYDVKHASHLVRLLLQGKQILEEQTLNTYLRPIDMQMVNDVRNGSLKYQELIAWADNMDKTLTKLYETSTLRHVPDKDTIEQICVNILYSCI